ncbi:lysine decarboxylase [Prochlorococcus sp. MIT 0601]|uniref:Orn/Lys/Arg family decarboxylase n=1 Tax=Prochlorococcus sp. MIT 0601 TaxID=1499498 RepID=UPI0005338AE7|nr:lysine decarboxylase [Prochlorococcus sp. MIT 0601]KGG12246.1 Lysine decarboxylase [Prochlorococcus sp. MIT 0601]
MKISDLLTYKRGKNLFLPAHGRGFALPTDLRRLLRKRPGIWDLPELLDIGGPLCSIGAIAVSQDESAKVFGADHCWYGVNGATGLLQASLLAIAKPGEAILMPRNAHRSLIQACVLGDIVPVLFDIPYLSDRGHAYPPDIDWLNKVLKLTSSCKLDITAAVLINPTYHGYSSELSILIKRLHKQGLKVLVDEAHGTYFASDIDKGLPVSALKAGADLVVNSLHKSAQGIVQTAVLWSQGQLVDPSVISRCLGLLQTTSPSSLLLASCELALKELTSRSGKRNLSSQIDDARDVFLRLKNLGLPLLKNDDPLRLVLHSSYHGICGFDADKWFIKHGIIGELPEPGTLTFCLGFNPLKGLAHAMKKCWYKLLLDNTSPKTYPPFPGPNFPLLSHPSMSCSLAYRSNSNLVMLNEAEGLVSADLVCPYPPGIPVLIPGELLDQQRINWMLGQHKFWPNQIPLQVRVVS